MKKEKRNLYFAIASFLAFVLWTAAVCTIDVKAIGPENTSVGLALLNSVFHELTGVNMTLYTITDWLGLVPVAVVIGFGGLGLAEWISRKSIKRSIAVF